MIEEKAIENLLKEYVAHVEPSENLLRVAVPGIRKRPVFRYLAVGACVAVAGGLAIIRPQPASAAMVQRVEAALSDAKTMEYDVIFIHPDGSTDHRVHGYYSAPGIWRTEWSTPIRPTYYLNRDGKMYSVWKNQGFATVSPDDDDQESPNLTGIEFAKQVAEEGETSIPVKRKVVSHEDVNGRATYAIVADRASDQLHSVMVVDRATNLPISVDVSLLAYTRQRFFRTHCDYQFNIPIDPDLFKPNFDLPVLDLPAEEAKLHRLWASQTQSVRVGQDKVEIMDTQVNKEGVVFLLTKGREDLQPTDLHGQLGTTYLPQKLELNYAQGHSPDTVFMTAFVPLKPNTSPPQQVTVDLPGGSAEVALPRAKDEVTPGYLRIMDRTRDEVMFPEGTAHLRGDSFFKAGEYASALEQYRKEAQLLTTLVPTHAWRPMEREVECLQKLGKGAEAEKVRAQADRIKSSDSTAANRPATP